MTLQDGILKDAKDRTGYIASNYQFQFDGPPQAGALFTAGFSACRNQKLAFGSSTVFWQCQSGDFYNLYDRNWAEQCEPVEIIMMACGAGSAKKEANAKRVVGSIVATTVVTVVSNGQTQVLPTTIAVPMCQIGDGQVQVRTTPCDDMHIPIITAPPVSQVSNGRIQVPTTAPPAPPVTPAGVPDAPDAPEDAPDAAASVADAPEPEGTPDAADSAANAPEPEQTVVVQGTTGEAEVTGQAARPTGGAPEPTEDAVAPAGDGSMTIEVLQTDSAEEPTVTRAGSGVARPTRTVERFDTSYPTDGDSAGAGQTEAPDSPPVASLSASMSIIPAFVCLIAGTVGALLVL